MDCVTRSRGRSRVQLGNWSECCLLVDTGRSSARYIRCSWLAENATVACLVSGSVIDSLPIEGNASGKSPEIELTLVYGGQWFTLDSPNKHLILKQAVDRDFVCEISSS